MQIKTVIVDDNEKDLSTLLTCFNFIENESIIQFDITTYSDNEINENIINDYLLYILDIDMPFINGFDLARKINEANKNAIIIFCSQHADLVFDSFSLEASYFIRKSYIESDFKKALDKVINILKSRYKQYEYVNRTNIRILNYFEIAYFEVNYNDLYIHLFNGEILKERKTMKKLVTEIANNNFIKIHYSFLVNAEAIDSIYDSRIKLKNGIELPVSQNKIKSIKQNYLIYMSRR
ncbi:MAG: LytTR family DNA-binding domain-containing protein [Bacilli bacterium]|jgi:two-component system, LytTR family, response regulator LytT|uniref:LytR/AlgR family response regulator transcription factor n=1 Tax=Anaerorhabdus sp. TaxID=1872524 RepID=UPI002FC5B8B8